MKKILFSILAITLLATAAMADDVPLKWDKVTDSNCAGYVIQMSTDLQNWEDVWSTGDPNIIEAVIKGVPGDRVVYFRAASLNAAGNKFPMQWSGPWYDGRLRPVSVPLGAGIH